MTEINWDKVYKLSPSEFSENPIHAEPSLIYALGDLRKAINNRLFPSPVKGALARFTGNPRTQHYATGRLSTACDIFCEGIPIYNFITILSLKKFNGIGVYLDTTGIDGLPWVMFHVDQRSVGFNSEIPLIWIAEKINGKTTYRYPQRNPEYWRLLQDERLYQDKIKGASEIA